MIARSSDSTMMRIWVAHQLGPLASGTASQDGEESIMDYSERINEYQVS